jgi:hypothetical protein
VIRDLAVMLADGGDCLADLGALGDQESSFGNVASASTAFRLVDRIAQDPAGLEMLRAAHAQARVRVWELTGAPERLTIDLDATLIDSHSEKEGAAGNFKGGYGFHPMLAYGDETSEALAGELRPGNASANTTTDQITVAEQAVGQIPVEYIESIKLLLRVDSAGSSHDLLDWAREGRIEFSVGYELNEGVRSAILEIPDSAWVPALDQDGSPRPNGQVTEITGHLDLVGWPAGSRVIVRRERAHPGAQPSFTDHDGHRFQAILTGQAGEIAHVEREHRGRARVEDHIRNDKDTGMRNLPFRDFQHNRVWLELVRIAHDLLVWTKRLLLTGELARSEPKRLRYRPLHVAASLSFHARTATLRIQASWPSANELTIAFARLRALPAPPTNTATGTTLSRSPAPRAPRSLLATRHPPVTMAPRTTPQARKPDSPRPPQPPHPHRPVKHSHQTLRARSGLVPGSSRPMRFDAACVYVPPRGSSSD